MPGSVKLIDGIKCYAPDLAYSNEGFHAETFELFSEAEKKNFWFISRNNVLQHLFKKHLGAEIPASVLEVGCGTGLVLKALSRFKNYRLTGAEIYLEGLKYARKNLPDLEFIQMDATDMTFQEEFDAIGAFDVIEHIDEDELVIKNVYHALKKNGCFFVTVPQYMFLWSEMDDFNCHKRRYSKKELITKLRNAGFKIEYCGAFVFTLFPVMVASRFRKQLKKRNRETISIKEAYSDIALPSFTNSIFRWIMFVDEWLIKLGIPLPFGGSLIAVARK